MVGPLRSSATAKPSALTPTLAPSTSPSPTASSPPASPPISHLGSNYGVLQSSEQQGLYKLSVRTRVKGLYLTGQSLGLMGLVGVSVTAFRTAGEILGLPMLYERVRLD